MDAMWKSLAMAMLLVAGCAEDRTFVNIGKDANGNSHGVPKADVDKYAADHAISFQEATRQMGRDMSVQK
jgi:hypothetical protein